MDKFDRNVQMLEDRRAGMTYRELAEKYGVSRQRAHELVVQTEAALQRRSEEAAEEAKRKAYEAMNPIVSGVSTRARNAFASAGIYSDADLRGKTEDDLLAIAGIGESTIDRIRELGGL